MHKDYLITGGAGFIGVNLARRLIKKGARVTLYDNLSRHGTADNIARLKADCGAESFRLVRKDIRDAKALAPHAKKAGVIYHFAAQVAVTASVTNPVEDSEINVRGAVNLLEAARNGGNNPILIYSSTNKVYGDLERLKISKDSARYLLNDYPQGLSESIPLEFHSPYGCSKGAADQYFLDYHRTYSMRTVVFRQSCIYGYHQNGSEDQGWVAWFLRAAIKNLPITVYGDGFQTRDLLFIDDLLNAYEAAEKNIERTAGQAYNIGGGPENACSIWKEFGEHLHRLTGRKIAVRYGPWRQGDQKIFVCDIRKAASDFGWRPKVGCAEGIERLYRWMTQAGNGTGKKPKRAVSSRQTA